MTMKVRKRFSRSALLKRLALEQPVELVAHRRLVDAGLGRRRQRRETRRSSSAPEHGRGDHPYAPPSRTADPRECLFTVTASMPRSLDVLRKCLMPVRVKAGLAALALSGAGVACDRRPDRRGRAAGPPPTFSKDVAPILFEHCATCHRPGQGAPFTLLTYAGRKPRADKIARVTRRGRCRRGCRIPSSPGSSASVVSARSDRHDSALVRDRRARGRARDLPTRPSWTEGWQLGQPDLVLTPPSLRPAASAGRRLPQSGDSRRRSPRTGSFAPSNSAGRRARPSRGRAPRSPSASRRRDGADGQPGFDGMGAPGTQEPDGHFVGWAPGRGPIVAPEGMPWRLARGTDLVLELHLIPGKAPVNVQPAIALYFADAPAATPPDVQAGIEGHRHSRRREGLRDHRHVHAAGRRRSAERLSPRAFPREGDAGARAPAGRHDATAAPHPAVELSTGSRTIATHAGSRSRAARRCRCGSPTTTRKTTTTIPHHPPVPSRPVSDRPTRWAISSCRSCRVQPRIGALIRRRLAHEAR